MLHDPAQLSALGQYSSTQIIITLKQRLLGLPIELLVMILCMMTASELTAFRRCCIAFNVFYTNNETPIIRGILRNCYYSTISTLHGVGSVSAQLNFKSLKYMARRSEIAESLATSIAERYVEEGLDDGLEEGLEARITFVRNIKPYLLALGHFFEQLRTDLVDHANYCLHTPSDLSVRARLQSTIIKGKYSGETYRRIWLTYLTLTLISRDHGYLSSYILAQVPPDAKELIPAFSQLSPLHLYLFCGLEITKDVLAQPNFDAERRISVAHFAKMTQIPVKREFIVALPPSVLGPPLNLTTVGKICDLFPCYEIGRFSELPDPPMAPPGEKKEKWKNFLEYLKTYEGEDPELLS